MVQEVQFNTKNENPFYGMSNTLTLFQNASKGNHVSETMMKLAWDECEDINQKALLVSILFSIGDITGRQHNLFERKVENGGNSQRDLFRDTIIPFLVKHINKKHYQELMTLITEYSVMDNILANRVQTKKKTTNVIRVIDMISVFGINNVAEYCANIINKGTEFQKICLAKFLTRPRQSKRAGHNKMLAETQKVMETQVELLKRVSTLCALSFEDKRSYIDFNGYYNWRKEYNENLESVLFSTARINDFDKEEFLAWLNMIPSDARFRVKTKVMYSKNEDDSLKWKKQAKWFTEWETFKEEKQKEQRVLETKIAQGTASTEDKVKLKKVKKQAKVTVGGDSFDKLFGKIVNGTIDKLKLQPIMDKINLPYNTLVFCDDSGSMSWGGYSTNNGFTPRQFAAFMATICLMKNPDDEARNLIGMFSRDCRMFNGVSSYNTAPNRLLAGQIKTTIRQPLIKSEDSFLNNLQRVSQFINTNSQGAGTYVSSVFNTLHKWAMESPNNLEELQRYPVWTFISDGNFNNRHSVAASINDFFGKMQHKLGFKPFIVLIDVAGNNSAEITQFEGVDNVMMIPPNPAAIELFLTNFRDMDIYDVYTPLLSVYRSKRYGPVRDFVYSFEEKSKKKRQEVLS